MEQSADRLQLRDNSKPIPRRNNERILDCGGFSCEGDWHNSLPENSFAPLLYYMPHFFLELGGQA